MQWIQSDENHHITKTGPHKGIKSNFQDPHHQSDLILYLKFINLPHYGSNHRTCPKGSSSSQSSSLPPLGSSWTAWVDSLTATFVYPPSYRGWGTCQPAVPSLCGGRSQRWPSWGGQQTGWQTPCQTWGQSPRAWAARCRLGAAHSPERLNGMNMKDSHR